jgi:hypothetical protein
MTASHELREPARLTELPQLENSSCQPATREPFSIMKLPVELLERIVKEVADLGEA